MSGWIAIKGARQHNLKNIDVALPKERLVVITGPSGAGKSSLAFDTLYAEGQRRYVESLSPAARQFLTQLEKPDVDAIEGLAPAIAIQQRPPGANPRSTVGTVSDIHDFLRLLYARVGEPVCYNCGRPIRAHTVQQVVDRVLAEEGARRLMVCAPQSVDPALDWGEVLVRYRREGFVRLRIDGTVHGLEDEVPRPEPEADVALVLDRLTLADPDRQRLTEAVEQAFHFGQGVARLVFMGGDDERTESFSRTPRCPDCGIAYPEPQPRLFSFNSPYGACPDCHGLGRQESVDPERVVPDPRRSLAEGAIAPWGRKSSPAFHQMLDQVASHYGFSIFEPFRRLGPEHQRVLLYGSGDEELEFSYEGDGSHYRYRRPFEGAIANLERRYRETESGAVREEIRRYLSSRPCDTCGGARLRQESLHFRVGGRNIAQVTALPLELAREWAARLELGPVETRIAANLIREIEQRLGFLIAVGLHYLALDRTLDTLSTGEAQRILLATQIGSALSGVIYILDEPTVGLHQRDTGRLLGTLEALRDTGNTVVVVEHDRETLARADYLIEIGPHAGEAGGRLVAAGTPEALMANPDSLTGRYLAGSYGIPLPERRRPPGERRLALHGAHAHNLQHVDVELPLGLLVCVTGVSGSGKSSLVLDTLYPALRRRLGAAKGGDPPPLEKLEGVEFVDRVIHVDQAAIGRSGRSNPATYLGVFARIREHFAALPESRARGYTARRFSFNVAGGRCEVCQGEGTRRIEMHFLPDVYVHCETCDGRRYNRETLEIRYRGKTVADVLEMTVDQAAIFFHALPAVRSRLEPMLGVGLGYLPLGQPAGTLSGGEAQRLKIARELGRREPGRRDPGRREGGRTLYLLDEPTTGLHAEDVARLLDVLNRLVDEGHSVVLIEHNLEVIKCADYLIDLGPEAGAEGGRVMAVGTPEAVVEAEPDSPTGRYLAPCLTPPPPRSGAGTAGKERVLHTGPPNP